MTRDGVRQAARGLASSTSSRAAAIAAEPTAVVIVNIGDHVGGPVTPGQRASCRQIGHGMDIAETGVPRGEVQVVLHLGRHIPRQLPTAEGDPATG